VSFNWVEFNELAQELIGHPGLNASTSEQCRQLAAAERLSMMDASRHAALNANYLRALLKDIVLPSRSQDRYTVAARTWSGAFPLTGTAFPLSGTRQVTHRRSRFDEMATNEYQFITHWRVRGDIHTVADILNDPLGLMRWWPSVYCDVRVIVPGDANGVGREVEVQTKGWLPYTLRWCFRVTDVPYPHGFTLQAQGDFVGRGIWTLAQDGAWVDVAYDWQIAVAKPLLRRLSFLFK